MLLVWIQPRLVQHRHSVSTASAAVAEVLVRRLAMLPGAGVAQTKPAVQVTVQRLAFIACLIVCLVRLCLELLTGTSQYCMPLLQPQCQVFNPADTIMQSCIFGSTADAEAIFICCGAASNDNLPGHYVALAAQSADNCGSWYAAACKPALCTCLSCLC